MDKRRFYRWECSIPCTCDYEGGRVIGNIRDLSYDGVRVTDASRIPPEGAEIVLELELGKEHVKVKGWVVYVRPEYTEADDSFGVQFHASAEERFEKLLPIYRNLLKPEDSDEQ